MKLRLPKKLTAALIAAITAVGMALPQTYATATIVTLGEIGTKASHDFVTDSYVLNSTSSAICILNDGSVLTMTTPTKFWGTKYDSALTGTWSNSAALNDMNTTLGSSFVAEDFSAGINYCYTAPGNQNSVALLSLDSDLYTADSSTITMYVTVAARSYTMDNFSVTGLTDATVSYATNGGDGFSASASFSDGAAAITMIKIEGTLNGSDIRMTSTTQRNGWQTISYVIGNAPAPEEDLVWNGTDLFHVWDTTTANWKNSGGETTFTSDKNAIFNSEAAYTQVSIGEVIQANKVSVADDYTFTVSDTGSFTARFLTVAEGKKLTLDGTGTYIVNKAAVAGSLEIGAGATLKVTGAGTATISTLSGEGNLTVGGGCIATVDDQNSYTGTVDVTDGGTLNLGYNVTVSNLTVERGTVTTPHSITSSNSKGVVANTLTVGEGGTFLVIGNGYDTFGNDVNATKDIVMQGAEGEGNRATLALEPDHTAMTTNITMRGYSSITVKDGSKGFNTFGGNITVDGVENSIAVIDLRNDVTIDVAAEGELSVGKFTQWHYATGGVSKTGAGTMSIMDASMLPGMLNINGGMVSIEADATLAGLSLNANGALKLTAGANMHIGSIVSMGADQSTDAMISGALEVANDNMHGVGGKGVLENMSMETSANYTIENMSISGSLIDVGEGTKLYLVNVDIHSDTHITDEAAWLDMQATNAWLDENNAHVMGRHVTTEDTTLYLSGNPSQAITMAAGRVVVELTSDMFDTVTMTGGDPGVDLWLDMTAIADAFEGADYVALDFRNLAREFSNAMVDVEKLQVNVTLDGETYKQAYAMTDHGTTTTLYFAVPEPTTSTLSLLALAALAARRRRK